MRFFQLVLENPFLSFLFLILSVLLFVGILKIDEKKSSSIKIITMYTLFLGGFLLLFNLYFSFAIPKTSHKPFLQTPIKKVQQQEDLAKKIKEKLQKVSPKKLVKKPVEKVKQVPKAIPTKRIKRKKVLKKKLKKKRVIKRGETNKKAPTPSRKERKPQKQKPTFRLL